MPLQSLVAQETLEKLWGDRTGGPLFWGDSGVPKKTWIRLASDDPGSGTSPSNEITGWSPPGIQTTQWTIADGVATSTAELSYTPNSSATVTWFFAANASSGTSVKFVQELTQDVAVQSGDPLKFRTGKLIITIDGFFSEDVADDTLTEYLTQTTPSVTQRHLGLSTTAPNADGTNVTEPSSGGYARIDLYPSGTNAYFPDNATNYTSYWGIANDQPIVFAEATGDWGTVSHFVIYDAATSGNMLFYGTLGTAKAIVTGTQARFPAGDLEFRVACHS